MCFFAMPCLYWEGLLLTGKFPTSRLFVQVHHKCEISCLLNLVIRPAIRTEVLLPEAPHRFRRLARTFPGNVQSLLAAQHMPATAHAEVDRLPDPGEFGADLLNTGTRVRQGLLRFNWHLLQDDAVNHSPSGSRSSITGPSLTCSRYMLRQELFPLVSKSISSATHPLYRSYI
jgi:hypothetical protein